MACLDSCQCVVVFDDVLTMTTTNAQSTRKRPRGTRPGTSHATSTSKGMDVDSDTLGEGGTEEGEGDPYVMSHQHMAGRRRGPHTSSERYAAWNPQPRYLDFGQPDFYNDLNRHYHIANKEMFDMFPSPSSSSYSMCSAADCGGVTRGREEEEWLRSLRVLCRMGRGTEHREGSNSVAEGNYGSEEFFMWVKMPANNQGTVACPMPGDVIHLHHPMTISFSAACVVRASFFDS